MNDLTLKNLRKEFPGHDGGANVIAVHDANLEVPRGTLVTLLGPSGCGKTTLLRMIAGFEEPTRGQVLFGDRDVTNDPPNRRDTAMVFQSYAIFPHLNVFDNVAFGLKLKGMPARELRERVQRVLDVTGLSGYEKRSPSQLSGGQQQRVALARSIVMEPRLLLFDEPLSNLDAKLREQMRVEIRELQQRLGITTIYVTHDQVEAMSISDVVVVMEAGHIRQIGSPEDIYARPKSHFVADFIGKANFLWGEVLSADLVTIGSHEVAVQPHDHPSGQRMQVMIRPEALSIDRTEGQFKGTVERAMFLGSILECVVNVEDVGRVMIDIPNPVAFGRLEVGQEVYVTPIPGLPAVVERQAG